MDDRTHKILLDDNATSDEILAAIGEQAKIAFQAELDFFEWQVYKRARPLRCVHGPECAVARSRRAFG
jgi:hypothetical protein